MLLVLQVWDSFKWNNPRKSISVMDGNISFTLFLSSIQTIINLSNWLTLRDRTITRDGDIGEVVRRSGVNADKLQNHTVNVRLWYKYYF